MEVILKDLTKKFPSRDKKNRNEVTAVDHFTFEIPDGRLIGLLGPSGCGKSTVLNLISGLLKPTEGSIFFGEDDVTDLPPENRGIGLVFQNYALYPHLTVRQNILFPLENLKGKDRLSKEEMQKKVDEAARLVQIDGLMDRRPRELSGGQQQRVAIARALALHPDILYFDEPTSALDPEITAEILRVMKQLAAEKMTMVVVTHEIDFARAVSDRVVFMDNGYVVENGRPEDVIDNPRNERTRAFLQKLHI